jgi:hypothetical protein
VRPTRQAVAVLKADHGDSSEEHVIVRGVVSHAIADYRAKLLRAERIALTLGRANALDGGGDDPTNTGRVASRLPVFWPVGGQVVGQTGKVDLDRLDLSAEERHVAFELLHGRAKLDVAVEPAELGVASEVEHVVGPGRRFDVRHS